MRRETKRRVQRRDNGGLFLEAQIILARVNNARRVSSDGVDDREISFALIADQRGITREERIMDEGETGETGQTERRERESPGQKLRHRCFSFPATVRRKRANSDEN